MAAITRPGQHGGPRAAYGLFDGKAEAAPSERMRVAPEDEAGWRSTAIDAWRPIPEAAWRTPRTDAR